MDMNLCEIDNVKVHKKVPVSKRCTPTSIDQDCNEQLCSLCSQMYSSYINKNSIEEICLTCYKQHATREVYMDKDEHGKTSIKNRIDLLLSAVDKTYSLFASRLANYDHEISSFHSKFNEFIAILQQRFTQCEHENTANLKNLEEINLETMKLVNRLKSNNLTDILLFLSKNDESTSKQTLDKLQAWVKTSLKKLVVPPVCKFNIEPLAAIRFDKEVIILTKDSETSQAVDCFLTHAETDNSYQEPCSSWQAGIHDAQTFKRSAEKDVNEDVSCTKRLLVELDDNDAAINPEDMFLSSDDENSHPIMSFGDTATPGLYGETRFESQATVNVRITGLRCPLWMFFEKPEYVEKRIEIIKMLDNFNVTNLIPAFDVKQGDYVIVQDTPTYGSKLKRGKIKTNGDSRGNSWVVKLLDYGRDISVQRDKIFMYPEDFDFTEETCFHGALLGIKPRSNFIFMAIQNYNCVSFIEKHLIPPSEKVMINRRYVTKDGRIWCDIKLKKNDLILNWAKELIKANLALNYPMGPFITSIDYCYLGHFNGKCRADCPHVHKCPYDGKDHFLKSCPAFIMETRNAEKEILEKAQSAIS